MKAMSLQCTIVLSHITNACGIYIYVVFCFFPGDFDQLRCSVIGLNILISIPKVLVGLCGSAAAAHTPLTLLAAYKSSSRARKEWTKLSAQSPLTEQSECCALIHEYLVLAKESQEQGLRGEQWEASFRCSLNGTHHGLLGMRVNQESETFPLPTGHVVSDLSPASGVELLEGTNLSMSWYLCSSCT